MNTRKLATIIVLLTIFGLKGHAQVSYFGRQLANTKKVEEFKSGTTLFTLQYRDYAELEKFDQAIKKVWTVTPYRIIKPEELGKYSSTESYSFFSFDAFNNQVDSIKKTTVAYMLTLVTPSDQPKKKNLYSLGFVSLFPDLYTGLVLHQSGAELTRSKSSKRSLINAFYNSTNFYNWSPGLLAGYLKQINDGLEREQSRLLDFQFYNKVYLPELTKETLYVPEYIRQLFSSQEPGKLSDEKLEPYNYKLKFVQNKQLDSLILAPESDIKYMVYTQRDNDKIISIYDSKNNQIIYQMFYGETPEFETNDLNRIKQTIKNIEKD